MDLTAIDLDWLNDPPNAVLELTRALTIAIACQHLHPRAGYRMLR